ncbi:MAG: prepilin peptidase, partial [Gammaproteobacteria bacterium]|nr:prepilin peptidase [Gammaproteobacteria bacterium]
MDEWFVYVLAVVLGLIFGSLLNVIISRIPSMTETKLRAEAFELLNIDVPAQSPFNLFVPRSHCPACLTPLSPLHMVPIVSWIFLRGECAYCGAKISARYPLIE